MPRIKKIKLNNTTYDVGAEESIELKDIANSSIDFAVIDEDDNTILVIENGNIRTKNFDSKTVGGNNNGVFVTMEHGNINTNSTTLGIDEYYSLHLSKVRTAFFINVQNGTELVIPNHASYTLFMYNTNYECIGCTNVINYVAELLATTKYIRFVINSGDSLDDIKIIINGAVTTPIQEKRVPQRKFYPNANDTSIYDYVEKFSYDVDGEMYTVAQLVLAKNYTPNDKKSPLIIWDSGDGSYSNWDTYNTLGTNYQGRNNGLRYLRDEGFSILEIYSWGSYYHEKYPSCGGRSAMPIPTHLKTHEKGVEYVLSRYNIDENNIFHVSKSGSGKLSLWYALESPSFNLKAIYPMAPVFDDLNFMGWGTQGYRQALYEELNLKGTTDQINQFLNGTPIEKGGNGSSWKFGGHPTEASDLSDDSPEFVANIASNQDFILNNAGKFMRASVCWHNLIGQTISEKVQDTFDFGNTFWDAKANNQQGSSTTGASCYNRYNLAMIGNGIPMMVIMGKSDEQTPFWSAYEVVKQLTNGGCEASIIETNYVANHSSPDLSTDSDSLNVKTNITTRLGVTYSTVSIGWYFICQDINKKYLAHIDDEIYNYVYPSN